MVIPYRVVFYRSDKVWIVKIPAFGNCKTHGETLDEANDMLQYLYDDLTYAMREWGLALPPSDLGGWGLNYTFDFEERD